MKLDIGCGISKKNNYLGVDKLSLPGVDYVHDLDTFPYPFKDNSVDEIWMDQVLEHLNDPVKVVEELFRICKDKTKIVIGVPYFRSFYSTIDPTHKNFFGTYWFNYFDPRHNFSKRYQYSTSLFLINRIEFDREFLHKNLFHYLAVKFANRFPHLYEEKISHLYPLNSLTFYLEVFKK